MKKYLIALFIFCGLPLFAMKDRCYWNMCHNSFSYVRVGGYTVLHMPIGAEVALGHRERNFDVGFGPLLNISVSPFSAPTISVKYEALLYVPRCEGLYFGIMPGIGIANIIDVYHDSHSSWAVLPTCEFLVGREFLSYYGTPNFYYLSISCPYFFSISFNYGWGF